MAKDAFWFHHDANARHDPRLVQLKMRYGMAAVGIWWNVIEMLRESADYKLPDNEATVGTIAYEGMTDPDGAREILEYCVEIGLLARDEDAFYSPSLCRRMERWEEAKQVKSEKAAAAARAKWDKVQAHSGRSADAVQTHSEPMHSDAIRREERRGEEKRGEESLGARDDVVDCFANALSARLPRTAWRDPHEQAAALRRVAKMTRETQPQTPIASPESFATIAVEQYERMKRAAKNDYWRTAAFDPVSFERRFTDVVQAMAEAYGDDQRQEAGLEALHRLGVI